MHFIASVAAVLGMAASAQAHMAMTNPAPLRSPKNKFSTNVDYDMTTPLAADGSNFPCRGSINLVGTAQGAAVAEWAAGSKQSLSIDGGAWHNGGSCQASLSYDKGKTWTVIHSWLGSCPVGPGSSSYDFSVPADAAAGEAVFAWSWFNKVGNREMYMNCAVVNIKAGSGGGGGPAFSSRPAMFVANVNNGCGTTEGTDLQFPNPGPDVTTKAGKFGPPTGSCPGSTGGGSQQPPAQAPAPPASSSAAAAPPASSAAPAPAAPSAPSSAAPAPAAPSAPSSASPAPVPAPSSSKSVPGGVFIPTSSATGPGAVPTTIQTSIRPTQSSPAAAPPAGTSSAPAGAQPTGGAGGFPAYSKCDELGAWNCIGGNQFQRCGAGNMWSPAQGLAAGTSCKPGVAKDIVFA
ncbi:hypothetical protein ISF_08160 [Cordyceps fumosorosea ARSEF 2679]|uniref:Extracellular protein n=1 Tax=Cordyceps fumosorosea (strain ARSEF 2679) TaxID=1081104 RepID=A0A167MY28_CORFA|nr:hypothetical protein ISF_08160 [Cordyceps fumosorosea ARSEF 2679]OAA54889.1 hypothetical protein ISF_08160 [Cordyceps fumosorosea ARSEF 2679]